VRVDSAVDWWIRAIIWGSVFILMGSIAVIPQTEGILFYIVGASVVMTAGVLLWIYYGSYYEFYEEYLYCKSGPFFERIPYDRIRSVRLAENMLSSMALSTKRIEIRQHGKGFIMGTTYISPVEREEFMLELVRRCPNLEH